MRSSIIPSFNHWSTTRYSDGTFGVWYGTDSLETGIHETVYHWRYGLLQDAGWEDHEGVTIERKMYHVRRAAQLSPKACGFSVTG